MGLIVQKFGGTSVADAERIHRAAKRAIQTQQRGNQVVVVVVSAMGDATDDLIELAKKVCTFGGVDATPPKREMDRLLVTGPTASWPFTAPTSAATRRRPRHDPRRPLHPPRTSRPVIE
jgi:aspartate kinase